LVGRAAATTCDPLLHAPSTSLIRLSGSSFDLERDSPYDACTGLINIGCGPDDRPVCWDAPITPGAFPHPREYVGAIGWDWQDDGQAALYVEAAPYALLKCRPRRALGEEVWAEILLWLREKALTLIRLAALQPREVGTCCPFCEFVLPAGELLNGLLEHIAAAHRAVQLRGVLLGGIPVLQTDQGDRFLRPAERFD
jgi:hypothetical protein